MEPIIDMHVHAQDVQNDPRSRWVLRGVRAVVGHRGPIWLWEQLGYPPALAGAAGPFAVLTALETKVRIASANADALAASLARAGVSRAVVLPIEPFNDAHDVLTMARDVDAFVPFASVHPAALDAADRLDKLLDAGARGVKCHPILQEVPPEDPAWRLVAQVAEARGVPLLFHCGSYQYELRPRPSDAYGAPRRFEALLRAFPRLTVVLGHMGLHEWRDAIELARRHENAILETSFQHRSRIREALAAVGPERVVFGSDWPCSDISKPLAEVRAAMKSDAQLESVLWRNAERLVGFAP